MRYAGNVVITIVAFAALYLLYAHRYSHRPFDYLWQGYACPTIDFMSCVKGVAPLYLNVHHVDRGICKNETEMEIGLEKIAEYYADLTLDLGFIHGCRRSEFHRSQLTPAQLQKGSVIDDNADPAPAPQPAPASD